ncbi:MAG: S41 family peptidase [Bacteroidales bacterium]|jgi:C-terminal processing protease CtpA/Prc|nr:S41 family peptidase [Bacteroidales bacterium]
MKEIKYLLLSVLFSAVLLSGCKKDDIVPEEEKEKASDLTLKINAFIKTVMNDVYLWYKEMPVLDIKYETDSKAYFDKLLYTEDKWSVITDDVTTLEGSLEGVETTFGYSLAFGQFVNQSGTPTGEYFAIVEYVYPNSPASEASLMRGDLLVKVNGAGITESNYADLFTGSTISVTKGILGSSGISLGSTFSMTARVMDLDPVLLCKIIEKSGHKIGYLMYLQFIAGYDDTSLKTALQYLKDNQITDLVLDLRYNPGGQISAAQYLCSSLAPQNIVNDMKRLVTFQWNDKYQDYWTANETDAQLGVRFDSNVPVKLSLSKIYILTGNGSASASELTICGLEPYMNVILIGDNTYGKYTGSILFKPEDIYTNTSQYADFKDWGIMPIVIRYANSVGVTNFTEGFEPDFQVEDELLPAAPLGDLTEPLLKKAVEDITGEILKGSGKGMMPYRFDVIRRGSSRFDEQKRNLFINPPLPEKK